MRTLKGIISIVCFDRIDELKLSVKAVESSKLENQRILILCQLGNNEVVNYVESLDSNSFYKIFTPQKNGESVKSMINRNVFIALKNGFEREADYVVLIEDDIEVHPSFLTFIDQIQNELFDSRDFRAINGFSAYQGMPTVKNGYGKFRFGVGWGWSISSRVWNDLNLLWHGDEDAHWDGLIEPYIRTGFVVMPNTSLIKNHGLNGLGSNSGNEPQLSNAIANSFAVDNNSLGGKWKYNQQDIDWRKDCFTYLPIDTLKGVVIHFLFKLLYFSRPKNELATTQNRTKARLKALTFIIIRKMV